VRPLTVPPHSFSQIRCAIRILSGCESGTSAAPAFTTAKSAIAAKLAPEKKRLFAALDGAPFSVDESVPTGAGIRPRPQVLLNNSMNKSLIILALSLAIAPLAPADDPKLDNQKDKVSYSIGLDIGSTLKRQMIDVNKEVMDRGVQDGLSGAKPLLTDEQMKEVMQSFQKDMLAKQAAKKKEEGSKNAAEGKKFLDENKSKEGVKTTASGLQYTVEKEGTGPMPKATDTVKVNYRGTTIDGKEFDSSYKRGEPATFPVNRVIKGWTEALQLMKVGSKYKLFIPADLAYGERGAGSDIGPDSVLLFDVELLGIEPPATPGAKPDAAAATSPAASPAASPKKP
jgi:FKBP-type peptidyl-prolyl cis-trans isomerase FklB